MHLLKNIKIKDIRFIAIFAFSLYIIFWSEYHKRAPLIVVFIVTFIFAYNIGKDEDEKNSMLYNTIYRSDRSLDICSSLMHNIGGVSCLKDQPIVRKKSKFSEKYIVYKRDRAGFNNVRMQFETLIGIAAITGRTLVIPPKSKIAHWPKKVDEFDVFESTCLENVISVARELPKKNSKEMTRMIMPWKGDDKDGLSFRKMQKYSDIDIWDFQKRIFSHHECFLRVNEKNKMLVRNAVNSGLRFKQNHVLRACALLNVAGIAEIGGYNAVHVRRGDFANFYKNTQLSGDKIASFCKKYFKNSELPLLVVSQDSSVIKDFKKLFDVRSLKLDSLSIADASIAEFIACCGAHSFVGTPKSTFSNGIMHYRGKLSNKIHKIDSTPMTFIPHLMEKNCNCNNATCYNNISKSAWKIG